MRKFLIAAALGLGIAATGGAIRPAAAGPFNPGVVELGSGVTTVQYYRHHYHPRRHYGPPRHYYGPPRRYGYYRPAPPPPPRYYRPRHHHPYYGWR